MSGELFGGVADNRLRAPLDVCFDAVGGAWHECTEAFRQSARGRELIRFVDARVAEGRSVYPATPLRALQLTPLERVRVVILGQDPYHGPGQAQGLAFSVPSALRRLPPSLRNILAEVAAGRGAAPAADGDLGRWAAQGVLLLNAVFTVEDGAPQSHAGRGWEGLSDALIGAVSARAEPSVFLLWGAAAIAKRGLIDERRHAVFTANHPSPLSARRPPQPFLGCRHFGAANAWLREHRGPQEAIDW